MKEPKYRNTRKPTPKIVLPKPELPKPKKIKADKK